MTRMLGKSLGRMVFSLGRSDLHADSVLVFYEAFI